MAYRLGIDLGTSSIGAAAYRIDENRRPAVQEYTQRNLGAN